MRGIWAVGAISLSLTSSAIARPVTTADLVGKKICWSNTVWGEDTAVYLPGNKVIGSVYGVGAWEITALGVELRNSWFTTLANIQKLPDGTFTSDYLAGGYPGVAVHSTGKYCK
jgi:hypothetical protein